MVSTCQGAKDEDGDDGGGGDGGDDDDDGTDIYIMVRCMSVTFLLIFVTRNGRKRVLPFLDTFGSRNKRKCA